MKNAKMLAIALGALAVGASTTVALQGASAYWGQNGQQYGPNYSPERHEQMTKAFDANDYQAWKSSANQNGRATQVVNEQNFAKFSEAHKLMLEGKYDEAAKIRQELGLGTGRGMHGQSGTRGQGAGRGTGFVDVDHDGVCDYLKK